jgi:hypothetical protein
MRVQSYRAWYYRAQTHTGSYFVESQSGEAEPSLARNGSFNSALTDVIGHPKACNVPDLRTQRASDSWCLYTTQSSRTFSTSAAIVTTFGVSLSAAPNYSVDRCPLA